MPAEKKVRVVNLLIRSLNDEESEQFIASCESVELNFGERLSERYQPMDFVYFPTSGFIAMVTKVGPHQPLEIGLLGNEGMLGATLALGASNSPVDAVVQGSGHAWRMPAAVFEQQLLHCKGLRNIINRYLYILITQLAQSAGCSHFHAIEQRLARWLLMTHDRAHADNFHLTHEFLADMLGVRRSGVTIAAGTLQQKNLISYTRGQVCIMDRKGLEVAACECYSVLRNCYSNSMTDDGNTCKMIDDNLDQANNKKSSAANASTQL